MAHALGDGYIATIHAVGQRLLREFALEGGLSREQEVLPEPEAERFFHAFLGTVIGDDRHADLDAAARRMAIDDWRPTLRYVVDLDRVNCLGREELEASGRRILEARPSESPDRTPAPTPGPGGT